MGLLKEIVDTKKSVGKGLQESGHGASHGRRAGGAPTRSSAARRGTGTITYGREGIGQGG